MLKFILVIVFAQMWKTQLDHPIYKAQHSLTCIKKVK
jgi:hypothetical protein